jgi:translation initiation factor IF-2
MHMNILASINERVDVTAARKVAERHGFTLEHEKKIADHKPVLAKKTVESEEDQERSEDLVPRPPVVTFLGHVDHGKTSLLDRIRNTAVAKGEYGGITQHIGAYTVDAGGRSITFLDTPGHAAFTAMRARGANLTDIAVIIVAADDGVMQQTKEAIMHAKAAEIAIMVAINKMDLPIANPDRVKQQLQAEGLLAEDWGGEVICCPVSATTGQGIERFLEMILLQADMLDLKANPKRRAEGYVIEAQMEAGMGPTATLLVTRGTLTLGDPILCGRHWGRVKALINDHGVKVKSAPPSTPVKCMGLSGVPEAGAHFRICSTDRIARTLAEEADQKARTEQQTEPRKASLENLFDRLSEEEKLELKAIVKADTQGSIEAILHSLREIKSDKVSLNIILSGTGNVTTNDVMLASASDAVILGFHVAKEPGVDSSAKREGVEIRLHNIIYELIDQVRDAMAGLLAPMIHEKITGHAAVKQVFEIGKRGKVAGCVVTDGNATARGKVRVRRRSEVLYEGGVASLKRFQDSVSEVRESQECGISLTNFSSFEVGDIVEFYEQEEVAQTL